VLFQRRSPKYSRSRPKFQTHSEKCHSGFNADADLSLDGQIDNVDFDILSANWLTGGTPPPRHYYFHFDGLANVGSLTDSPGNIGTRLSSVQQRIIF
jgi:hypothetical protein